MGARIKGLISAKISANQRLTLLRFPSARYSSAKSWQRGRGMAESGGRVGGPARGALERRPVKDNK